MLAVQLLHAAFRLRRFPGQWFPRRLNNSAKLSRRGRPGGGLCVGQGLILCLQFCVPLRVWSGRARAPRQADWRAEGVRA